MTETTASLEAITRAIDKALGDEPSEVAAKILEAIKQKTSTETPTRDQIIDLINTVLGEGFEATDEELDELAAMVAAIDRTFAKGGAR